MPDAGQELARGAGHCGIGEELAEDASCSQSTSRGPEWRALDESAGFWASPAATHLISGLLLVSLPLGGGLGGLLLLLVALLLQNGSTCIQPPAARILVSRGVQPLAIQDF